MSLAEAKTIYEPYRLLPVGEGFAVLDGFAPNQNAPAFIYCEGTMDECLEWLRQHATNTNPLTRPQFLRAEFRRPPPPPKISLDDLDLEL